MADQATKVFLTFAVVAVLAVAAFGQPNTPGSIKIVYISGRLIDPRGTPIPNATVTLRSSPDRRNVSIDRTAGNGRFGLYAVEQRSYTVRFSAPGIEPISISIQKDGAKDLKDIVARLDRTSTTRSRPSDFLPAELLNEIKKDLGLPDMQDCVQHSGEVFEQMIRATWLPLAASGDPAFYVEGLGPCFAGANNGPQLVYIRLGNKWRKVFDESGSGIEVSTNRTSGLLDLICWQHDSAFQSFRFGYQFDGSFYISTSCNVAQFGDILTGQDYPKPRYAPCK